MLKKVDLNELQKFEIGSFAIWDDDGLCSKEFIESRISDLHGKVIFLGLNRSGKKGVNKVFYPDDYKNYEFRNFHTKNHKGDKILRKFIEGKLNKLEGAYMTDLYYEIQGDSGKIKKNDIEKEKAVGVLLNQINIIGEKSLIIICFGTKVFKHLLIGLGRVEKPEIDKCNLKYSHISNYNGLDLNIYRVWHYSNWGKHKEKIKELKKQLKYLNKKSV